MWSKSKIRAFSLTEMLIATFLGVMLVFSALLISKEFKQQFQSSENNSRNNREQVLAFKQLKSDIHRSIHLRPLCSSSLDTNTPLPSSVFRTIQGLPAISCSDIPISAGILAYPEVGELFSLPESSDDFQINIDQVPSFHSSDAIRILVRADEIECPLKNLRSENSESVLVFDNGLPCTSSLQEDGLYVIHQEFKDLDFQTQRFQNLVQLTNQAANVGSNETSFRVGGLNDSSLVNQAGGPVSSGFTSRSKVFRVKFVDWFKNADEILSRRAWDFQSQSTIAFKAKFEQIHFHLLSQSSSVYGQASRNPNQLGVPFDQIDGLRLSFVPGGSSSSLMQMGYRLDE